MKNIELTANREALAAIVKAREILRTQERDLMAKLATDISKSISRYSRGIPTANGRLVIRKRGYSVRVAKI